VTAAFVYVTVLGDLLVGGPFTALDQRVLDGFWPVRAGWVTSVAQLLAHTGHWTVQSGVLLAVAAVVATVRRSATPVVQAGAALVLVGVAGQLTKHFVARPGPRTGAAADALGGGTAFPSGHAAGAVVVGLLVAHLVASGHSSRARAIALGVGACWPLVVGWSRVHLCVHWASDVVGGWSLGLVVVGLVWLATPRSHRTDKFPGRMDQPARSPH
jgi:membrane-associated phospholipid phosphatase